MIDTIVLMLDSDQFEILEPDKFSPSASLVLNRPYPKVGKGKTFKCVQNTSADDKKNGRYSPRLTLILRPCNVTRMLVLNLKIELSLPKFFCGNNFDELTDDHLDLFCPLLGIKLKMMGVYVDSSIIKTAKVSSVHYSKNIILHDHIMCRHVLDELKKMDIFCRMDANEKDYRNQGHMIKWHANSYEVCLYDKVRDLKQSKISEKRSVETDQHMQTQYLDALVNNQIEVLRMEIRLSKTKMKSLFKKLKIPPVFTMQSLWSAKISQKILLHFWDQLEQRHGLFGILNSNPDNPQAYLEALQVQYPDLKPKEMMSIMATTMAIQQIGIAGFKATFPHNQQKTVKRLIDQAQKHQPFGNTRWKATQQIREKLVSYQTVSIERCIKNHEKIINTTTT